MRRKSGSVVESRSEGLENIAPPLRSPTIFMIVTAGRTGSNLLNSLLRSHPRIRAAGEVIGESRLRNRERKRKILEIGPEAYVKRCFDRTGAELAIGIKVLYYQMEPRYAQQWGAGGLSEAVHFLKSEPAIRMIHLKRRNRLKTLCSRRVAAVTRTYIETEKQIEKCNNVRISLTPDGCEQEFRRIGLWEKHYESAFCNHKILEVFYEDLVERRAVECDRVLDFLNVPRQALATSMKKQRTRHLSEVIENYRELEKHFSGTEWARFFDE